MYQFRRLSLRFVITSWILWLLWAASAAVMVRRIYFMQGHVEDLRMSKKTHPALTDRLVVVLTDSIPFEEAFDPSYLPFISGLTRSSTWGLLWTEEPSMSGVMFEATVTGNRSFMWTVLRGWNMQEMPEETFLDGLKEEGLRIEAWGDSPWGQNLSTRLDRSYTIAELGKDEHGGPIHWQDKLISMCARITDAAMFGVKQDDFDVFIWHLASTDLVMHRDFRTGGMVPRVLRYADGLIEKLFRRFDDGRTTFLFLSDHGCAANGRHGTSDPEARRAYYLLYGKGVRAVGRQDIKQIDISSTLLALFGRTPNAISAGRPLVEGLAVDDERRSEILLGSVRGRIRYLETKRERGDDYTPDLEKPRKVLAELEGLKAQGAHAEVAALSKKLLGNLHELELKHRRSNSLMEPLLWWMGLGLALAVLLLSMTMTDGRETKTDPTPWMHGILGSVLAINIAADLKIAGPALLVATAAAGVWVLFPIVKKKQKTARFLLFALPALGIYLVAVTLLHLWTGILCNTIIFNITENAEAVFVTGMQLLGVVAMYLLYHFRKPIVKSLESAPFAWSALVSALMAGLNGYYGGFYFSFAMGIFVLILWKGVPESFPAPKISALLPFSACILIFGWQTTWQRHLFFSRYRINNEHILGGVLGAAALIFLAWCVRWSFKVTKNNSKYWASAAYLGVTVAARHILWPTPAEESMLSLGHHLQAALPAQVLFGALTLPVFAVFHFMPCRKTTAETKTSLDSPLILLTLAAFAAMAGSPFETPLLLLLTAFFTPLVRHPIFSGQRAVSIPAAVFTLVVFSVFKHVVFDFRFNFTTVHDLMKFSREWGWDLWTETLPILAMRHLPATALTGFMFLHRMKALRVFQIGTLFLFFLASRSLYIIVLAHLSREQLYINWRNMGEILYYAFWAAAWAVVIPCLLYRARKREPAYTAVSAP